MLQSGMALAIAALLVMISGIAVVYAKQLNRTSFIALQQLQKQRDEMNIEWGQLQLEQSTFATHSKIEQAARERLNMKLPSTSDIVIVQP